MTHADDPRHIIYATWVKPKFFPYIRDLLCVLNGASHITLTDDRFDGFTSDELTKQPAQENLARTLLDTVFVQPSNTGCPCLILIEKLRAACKAYGERGMSIAGNRAWSAVSVAMVYFILSTDFYFAVPMTDQMKVDHLKHLHMLGFAGPKFPTQLLQ